VNGVMRVFAMVIDMSACEELLVGAESLSACGFAAIGVCDAAVNLRKSCGEIWWSASFPAQRGTFQAASTSTMQSRVLLEFETSMFRWWRR